jgi:serine/threonine protein kinase
MPVFTATERVGSVIDEKYAVQRVIAQGGMGVVFEATHTWTGRRVALKLIKPDLVEPTRNARLLVEARAATALSHPNVVQVLDMGQTEDGVSYLVMELLEGSTLKQELLARGTLPPAEALAIVLPLLGAIAVAHDRGIVHRDIKPANILLSRDSAGRRVPKLLDFGIAKVIEDTGVTHSGAVLGTTHYLSPEQAEGTDDVGPASDIWALGVVLYECLCGKLPFPGEHAASVLQRILNEPVPPLRTHAPQIGSALAQAVERALHSELRLRYDGARSFARALLVTARECGVELPEAPDPTGLPEWSAWLSGPNPGKDSTIDAGRARASTPVAMPSVARAARIPNPVAAWSLGLLVLLACLAYLFLQHETAPVGATSPHVSVTAASRPQPVPRPNAALPATPPADEDSAAATKAPPSSPSASVLPVAAPPTSTRAPARRRRRRATAPTDTIAPAPKTAPSSRDKLMQSW